MGFLHRIGNGMYRLMYGRNGMDQLNLGLIWASLLLDLVALLVGRSSVLAGKILYWIAIAIWACVVFRIFSKDLSKRRGENNRWLGFLRRIKSGGHAVRERRADKEHCYFTCRNCKTVCRVPVGKGKVVITCPKCGAQIRGKT